MYLQCIFLKQHKSTVIDPNSVPNQSLLDSHIHVGTTGTREESLNQYTTLLQL